jgi:hypothetical protein
VDTRRIIEPAYPTKKLYVRFRIGYSIGIKLWLSSAKRPETTLGNVNADVLADKGPHFTRVNFCGAIRGSA